MKDIKRAIALPVASTLLLPGADVSIHLDYDKKKNLDEALENGAVIILLRGSSRPDGEYSLGDFYPKGASFTIDDITNYKDGFNVSTRIQSRISIRDIYSVDGILHAEYVELPEEDDISTSVKAEMLSYIKNTVLEIGKKFRVNDELGRMLNSYDDVNVLMVYLTQFMNLTAEERYRLIDTDSQKERMLLFMDYLLTQKEMIKLNIEMQEKFSDEANQMYRKRALEEQLRAIQDELRGDNTADEGESDYRKLVMDANLPEEIEKAALEEVRRLEGMGREGMEQSVIRNYLDFILALPWHAPESPSIDINHAREILDRRHYGLKQVKDRIVQHLAVMHLKNDKKGSVLLLVGPPGTGKTSLGKSIAEALGREYSRMSLGGIRDESEIRGHRRTYVGAMAGRILQSIKRAGTSDPVIVLDEIDKLMNGGFSGDPASALLEVLDPEQNNTFTDHYLDLPYDLSNVFFIATANSMDTIPEPLLDRMEVIQISGYTPDEKFHIGREHLVPEILEEYGMSEDQLKITDDVLNDIIENFTREAGVRGLKKRIAAIARYASEKVVGGDSELPYTITQEMLVDILGKKVSNHEKARLSNPPGVVTGLAWTPVGGEILFIETTEMPGKGEVIITGQLGDVMQESARISLSLLRSRLPVNTAILKDSDLHIHVPSGATPKDGPSAGIALFTALASLVTGRPVDSTLAMTGEITLRGDVTPIGGLKEKLFGAHRAGIKKVLIPVDNEIDLKDIPEEVLNDIEVITVETAEDVLREALGISLPRLDHILYHIPGSGRVSITTA